MNKKYYKIMMTNLYVENDTRLAAQAVGKLKLNYIALHQKR